MGELRLLFECLWRRCSNGDDEDLQVEVNSLIVCLHPVSFSPVQCHSGVLGGGHYTSFAKNPNSKWFYYNDSTCKVRKARAKGTTTI